MVRRIWGPTNSTANRMKTSFSFVIFLFFFLNTLAQQSSDEFSVMFYNVENLFDVKNDPLTNDDDFTFEGERHWSYKKLNKKIQNTAKAILSAAGWEAPALVALCEIENRYVIDKLVKDSPLQSVAYKVIHKESPDSRGIDVVLLYNSKQFYPLSYQYYPLKSKGGKLLKSREILHVSGILGAIDTVHVFVNHWPSRYSGVMETRALRNGAAALLLENIELVLAQNPKAKIIVLGDFNDAPNDQSIKEYLGAKAITKHLYSQSLYNLSLDWENLEYGTLKYRSQWYIYDQIIVSGELLKSDSGLYTKAEWATICKSPFLLETDERYGGLKPKRTFVGYRYNGGFSDHLPVLLKLKLH